MTAYNDYARCAELIRADEGVELGLDWWARVNEPFCAMFSLDCLDWTDGRVIDREDYVQQYGEEAWERSFEFAREVYSGYAGDAGVEENLIARMRSDAVFDRDVVTCAVSMRVDDLWLKAAARHYESVGELTASRYGTYRFELSGMRGMTLAYMSKAMKQYVGRLFYHAIEERLARMALTSSGSVTWHSMCVELGNGAVRVMNVQVPSGTGIDDFPSADDIHEVYGRRFEAMLGRACESSELAMMRTLVGSSHTWAVVYHPDGMRTAECSVCGTVYEAGPRGRYTSLKVDEVRGFIDDECVASTEVCIECDRRRPVSEMTSLGNGRYICTDADDDCGGYNSHRYDECCCCGDTIVTDMEDYYSDADGYPVCDDCCSEYYGRCCDCDHLVHVDNAYYDEEDGNYRCDHCHEQHSRGQIRSYGYKPTPVFNGEARDGLYFGLEIETDCGSPSSFSSECSQRFGSVMYYKSDGSLSSDGVECVTHPMSYDYAMGFDWDAFHSIACDNDMRSHDTNSCGFHIHVSRDGLGSSRDERELTAAKMVLFFDHYRSELLKFSRRKSRYANEWARSNNADIKRDDSKSLAYSKAVDSSNASRYCAVNLRNEHTVEVRLWRGTTNPDTIRATIDLTNAIVQYCKATPLADLCEPDTLYDCVHKLVKEKTIGYMTLRGINPEVDFPRIDGEND